METTNKAKIQQMRADIAALELEDVRNSVLATDPGWLSEANKYMVSIDATASGAEVTVYRHDNPQSGGNLSHADIITLRNYLSTLITEEGA